MSRGESPRSAGSARERRDEIVNDCPKCRGQTDRRPCVEWVETLREEFTLYIDGLFRAKMKEFIDFVEDYIEVED